METKQSKPARRPSRHPGIRNSLATVGWAAVYAAVAVAAVAIIGDSFGDFGDFTLYLAVLVPALPWIIRQTRRGVSWEYPNGTGLSLGGWIATLTLFAAAFASSECLALVIRDAAPTAAATESYTEMGDAEALAYAAAALTIGPIFEEIACRWLLFRRLRGTFGFWPSFAISAAVFAWMHGTLMHIPTAVALSMPACLLYEATGRFRYCVILHLLYNWLGVFATPPASGAFAPVYAAVLISSLAAMAFLYFRRDRVFGELLAAKPRPDRKGRRKKERTGVLPEDGGTEDA